MVETADRRGRPRGKLRNVVRGKRAENDPFEFTYQREAVELYLVREGFSLTDIRGYEETTVVEEPRSDLWASLSRLTPRTVRAGIAGAVALGLLLSVETGYVSPLVVSTAVALVLHYLGDLPDPEPVTKVHRSRRSGLSEREVMDYLIMSNELANMKEEEEERARKDAERRGRING